jgi:c-di-GMP-binding flagellar brake protein YcgR
MSKEEKREYPRVPISNIVSYVCIDKDGNELDQGMGKTVNISQGGILLETTRAIESDFVLLMTVDHNNKVLQTRGEVVHTRSVESAKYFTGVRFDGDRETVIRVVKSFILDYHKQKNQVQKYHIRKQ